MLVGAELGSVSGPLHSRPFQALHKATAGASSLGQVVRSSAWIPSQVSSARKEKCIFKRLYHHFWLRRPTSDADCLHSPLLAASIFITFSFIQAGNTRGVTCLDGVHVHDLPLQQGSESYLRNIVRPDERCSSIHRVQYSLSWRPSHQTLRVDSLTLGSTPNRAPQLASRLQACPAGEAASSSDGPPRCHLQLDSCSPAAGPRAAARVSWRGAAPRARGWYLRAAVAHIPRVAGKGGRRR